MPGRRFPKNQIHDFFAANPPPAVPWDMNIVDIKGIGPGMQASIAAAMNRPPAEATLRRVLNYMLRMCHLHHAGAGPNNRMASIEAVITTMIPNARKLLCDPRTHYLTRVPNRWGFNLLAELIAYAKENPPAVGLTVNSRNFLNALQSANAVRSNVICKFNEGVRGGGQGLEPPQSPYLCIETMHNTAGGGTFAQAVSHCPCKNTQQLCGMDGNCMWDAGAGACLPSAASTQGRHSGPRVRGRTPQARVHSTWAAGTQPGQHGVDDTLFAHPQFNNGQQQHRQQVVSNNARHMIP